MFTILNTSVFVGSAVIQTPFTIADLIEYLIFFTLAIGGIFLIKKAGKPFIKVCGYVMAAIGIGCLCWLVGWQIYIRMFLL